MCGNPFSNCKTRTYPCHYFNYDRKIVYVLPKTRLENSSNRSFYTPKYIGDVSIVSTDGNVITIQEHHNIGKALLEYYYSDGLIPGIADFDEGLDLGGKNRWNYVRTRLSNSHIPAITLYNNLESLMAKKYIDWQDQSLTLTTLGLKALITYLQEWIDTSKSCKKAA